MLRKELAVSSYRLSAYFVARTAVMLPLDFVWTVVYCPVAYYMGNINDDPATFVAIFLAVNLTLFTFQSISVRCCYCPRLQLGTPPACAVSAGAGVP